MFWYFSAWSYWWQNSDFPLIFVTAADASHSKSLVQLIDSLVVFEPNSKVIIYDLGLTSAQLNSVIQRYALLPDIQIRAFEYKKYPDFFDVKVDAGQYAWKPSIIRETCCELMLPFIWMDSGNVIDHKLTWVRKFLSRDGFYCPMSSGSIQDWTHPMMCNFLNLDPDLLPLRNLNAAVIGFDPRVPKVLSLINKWAECALHRECIAPIGSSRSNHRQDQAALTILAYQTKVIKFRRPYYANQIWEPLGFRVQCDIEERLI